MNNDDNIDEHVQAGVDAGMSARAIAAELQVDRGRVMRVIARLKKQALAKDAAAQEEAEPTPLMQQIARLDEQIAAATGSGNAMQALRLAKVRATLVDQLPPAVEHEDDDGVDWARLSPAARSALEHLVHVAHGFPGNAWWAELFERIPATVDVVHPAHVQLPHGAPEGVRLLVP